MSQPVVASVQPGSLYVVATPIGNLDDISARALRILREVALIAAEDTRHSARLLQHFGIQTPLAACHEHNERDQGGRFLARLQAGEDVALTAVDEGVWLVRFAALPLAVFRERTWRLESPERTPPPQAPRL